MALTRTPEPNQALNPRESVSQYRAQILGGGAGAQPLPRTAMQSTTPKVPYPAKSGSGSAMPSTTAAGIFDVLGAQRSGSKGAAKKSLTTSRGGGGVPAGGGGGWRGGSGGDRAGAYGLESKAGAKLQALQNAYKQRWGTSLPVNSGGRSYADQVKAYNNYLRGGNLAARPGTSVHESGRAVDFGGAAHGYSPQHTWLVQNAPNFGWTWAGKNFSQVEPWHFEFQG